MIGRETLGTLSPVDHLRLIDLITEIVGSGQARGVANGTVDVDGFSAGATDRVMVIVTDSILVKSRRPGRLDAPDKALLRQNRERIVDRLSRNSADIGPNVCGDIVRRAMGTTRHRPQHGQSLGCDLEAVLAKKVDWIINHADVIDQDLDLVKT